jgi:hypothetical protein
MHQPALQHSSQALERRVFRPPYRNPVLAVFSVLTVASACFAIFGQVGWVIQVVIGVLAVWFASEAVDMWRQGLYVRSTGVRIVRPSRPRALTFGWGEIDRFERRSTAGESPVTLIRRSGQQAVAVPTFPKVTRRVDPSDQEKFRVQIQAQVDELNALLQAYSPDPVR